MTVSVVLHIMNKKKGHRVTRNWDQQFQTLNTTTSQKKETKICFIQNLGSYLLKLVNKNN